MSKTLPAGVVNIRGKEYQTVALRVHNFRAEFKAHSLITEVLHRDRECVVIRASISDEAGRVLATGHAEEYRADGQINATSALENAETSAIGRALAAFGLGGTEFASADEVARAVSGQKAKAGAVGDYLETVKIAAERMAELDALAETLIGDFDGYGVGSVCERLDEEALADDEKVYLWSKLPSNIRSAIKAHSQKLRQKEAA